MNSSSQPFDSEPTRKIIHRATLFAFGNFATARILDVHINSTVSVRVFTRFVNTSVHLWNVWAVIYSLKMYNSPEAKKVWCVLLLISNIIIFFDMVVRRGHILTLPWHCESEGNYIAYKTNLLKCFVYNYINEISERATNISDWDNVCVYGFVCNGFLAKTSEKRIEWHWLTEPYLARASNTHNSRK